MVRRMDYGTFSLIVWSDMRLFKWLKDNFWIIFLLVVIVLIVSVYMVLGHYLVGEDFWKVTNLTGITKIINIY